MTNDFDLMTEMLDWKEIDYKWNESENEKTIEILDVVFTFGKSGGLLKVEKLEKGEN